MNSTQLSAAQRAVAVTSRVLVLASAALLAGCYTAREVTLESIPDDFRQRHPIVLKEAPRTLELFIGNRRGTLTAAQRAEVLSFAHTWRKEATGGILIDVPSGTPNAESGASAAKEIRSILAHAGIPARAVEVRPHPASDPRKLATLKLHYPKVTADAGPCGLWPHDLGPTYHREHYENRQYYNFGCASQRNLAAMVDSPADLVQPRAEIPSYNGRRTTVLDKYHRGESSATVYPDAAKGKISDLGQ
jgi:pilus assembly protein CpaD